MISLECKRKLRRKENTFLGNKKGAFGDCDFLIFLVEINSNSHFFISEFCE